jgi:hypothetical protein
METHEAVPVSTWPALLVDIVLLPALPVALLFAVNAGWVAGSFIGAIVIAIVFFASRGMGTPARSGIVTMATAVYGVLALLGIELGTTFSCNEPNHPGLAWAAAGAVFVGLATLSIWKRFPWGIPIAVLLALVVFFTVYSKLPGIPLDCSGSD